MATQKDTKIAEVFIELRGRILSGEYITGRRLPPERELAEELGVSRDTVRAALFKLQEDDYVEIIPRSGVYVGSPSSKFTIGALKAREGSPFIFKRRELIFFPISNDEARGHILEEQNLGETGLYLPSEISEDVKRKFWLDNQLKIKVYRVYKLHSFDRKPLAISDTYFRVPWSSFMPMKGHPLETDEERQGFLELSHAIDLPDEAYGHAIEQLQARLPTSDEGKLLKMPKSSPVIEFERWVYKADGDYANYARWIMQAARFEFVYEVPDLSGDG